MLLFNNFYNYKFYILQHNPQIVEKISILKIFQFQIIVKIIYIKQKLFSITTDIKLKKSKNLSYAKYTIIIKH